MEIKILGKNSSNRMKLLKNLSKTIKETDEKVSIEIVEDEKTISKLNISNTPALIINNKIISQGKVLTEKEIKNYIRILEYVNKSV